MSLGVQSVVEPGAGEGPVPVGGTPGNPHRGGGLVQGQSSEEAELDQFRTRSVPPGEFLQGVVDGDEVVVRGLVRDEDAFEIDPLSTTASLVSALVPGAVNEDAAHGLGGGREEVPAAVPPGGRVTPDQSDVRLVDQRSRLQGLARFLLGHPGDGELAQLVVDEGE